MKTEYRQINKQTIKELCKNLENENWLDLYNIADTQEAYNLFSIDFIMHMKRAYH